MKYESKRHPGTIANLISEDSAGVKLRLEDGTEKIVSRATFRRWWKKLEEPIMESNVTSIPEVNTSTEQEHKKKSTKKDKSTESVNRIGFEEFLGIFKPFCESHSIEIKLYEKVKNTIFFKYNNRGIVRVYLGRKRIKVDAKSENIPEQIEFRKQNHYFSGTLMCDYGEDTNNLIFELLKSSI